MAPLLELQRTLLAEEEKTFTEARAAAAALAAGTSGAAVAGAAAAAMHQCHICALLSHRHAYTPAVWLRRLHAVAADVRIFAILRCTLLIIAAWRRCCAPCPGASRKAACRCGGCVCAPPLGSKLRLAALTCVMQVEQLADDMQTTMADDMPDAAAAADFHPSADAADDILAL